MREPLCADEANVRPSHRCQGMLVVSFLKSRPSQLSCVLLTDPLFGRSWSDGLGSSLGHCDPLFARTGSWRRRTSRFDSTCRVEGGPAAATADGYGPHLLARALEALEGLAEFVAGGAAREPGRLGPAGVYGPLGVGGSTPERAAPDHGGTPRVDFGAPPPKPVRVVRGG